MSKLFSMSGRNPYRITIVLLLILQYFAIIQSSGDDEFVVNYLKQFGYLNDNVALHSDNNTIFKTAIETFQEFYDLDIDGTINDATLNFMKKARCGLSDNTDNINSFYQKWNKTHIKWNYFLGNETLRNIAEQAFQIWSNVSGLTFEFSKQNPDIIISHQRIAHYDIKSRHNCPFPFDGPGLVLAHANYPHFNKIVEIHIDADEDWTVGNEPHRFSLFTVLTHEIGHALGIEHSQQHDSIMYSAYQENWSKKLHEKDISSIRNLYGEKKSEKPTTTPRIINKQTPIKPKSSDNPPDPCQLETLHTFLIIDQKILVMYEQWMWPIELGSSKIPTPVKLRDYLKYILHGNFKKITAIYQRPNGQILFIAHNLVYILEYPTMRLLSGYPKSFKEVFNFHTKNRVIINGIVNTNSGKTLIFYDNVYYLVLSECDFTSTHRGLISELLPGVPIGFQSVFRYANGKLYFFKKRNYYEFDEFKRVVTKSGNVDLGIFDINCRNMDILEKLTNYLQDVKTYFNMNKDYYTNLESDQDDDDDEEE